MISSICMAALSATTLKYGMDPYFMFNFYDRINRITWISFFAVSQKKTAKLQSPPAKINILLLFANSRRTATTIYIGKLFIRIMIPLKAD
jgi:hypothetical protein